MNNKLGDLQSSARNDITIYSNLIRLYLDIQVSRLSPSKMEIDKQTLFRRIRSEEIVSYAIFAVDKFWQGWHGWSNIAPLLHYEPSAPPLRNEPVLFGEYAKLNLIIAAMLSLKRV